MLVLWNNDGIGKQLLHKDYPKFYSLYVFFLESKMRRIRKHVTVLHSAAKIYVITALKVKFNGELSLF